MTETSAKKPSLAKKMLAFFMLLVFVLIGAGVVLYARQTQTESKPSVAKPLADLIDPAPDSNTPSDKAGLNLPAPILGEDTHDADLADNAMTGLDLAPPLESATTPPVLPPSGELALAEARTNQDLAAKISDLQKDVLQLMEKNAALTATVETLQHKAQEGVRRDLALLLAANHLQAVWQRPNGFNKELELLENLALGDIELLAIVAKITPAAQNGLPSPTELQTSFAAIAANAAQQQSRTHSKKWVESWAGQGSMIAEVWSAVASLVTIRRTGGPTDDPLERSLQSIQAALDAQQWSQAANAIRDWPQEWFTAEAGELSERLEIRADAENAMWQLQELIVRRVSQPVTN